ncbi:major capsid protein [Paracoccus sp. (in: a-proteobacteria)]|uniref:major capsid protein n=1 Tax=Paracoccus sp. TaxID=267 RepID=UPI0028B2546D|nr:major capsid protein [Paracoccus sp. (in: a-proteobacteria)]
MSQSQMVVFNQYFMPAIIETLGQDIAKFNAASGGSIVLSTTGFDGDFFQESFWRAIHSARRRVDRYTAQADVAATDLTQGSNTMVKVAGGFGPIRFEPAQMTWLQKPTAEGIEVASRNFAEALLQDQLNTAIAALVAAIGNVSDLVNDVSATGGLDYIALNGAHAKFGDRSGDIVANVLTGAAYHKLIGQNLTNAENLFQAGGVTVVNILGKQMVITDAPSLYEAGSPNLSKALGLVAGAATVADAGDVITNIETTNGKTRIETTLQADYTFGLGLKGYTWDTVSGGKSPTDAELATGANWDKTATDNKHTAGVLAIGEA